MQDCSADRYAFVIARHRRHGYLVLRSQSENGGRYALPCGVTDPYQVKFAGIDRASLATAAKVLCETTGLDFIENDHRLHPIRFPASVQSRLGQQYSFVSLELRDEDSVHLRSDNLEGLTLPKTGQKKFYLRLSQNHTAFYFEPDRLKAASAIKRQSGGKPAKALRAMQAVYTPNDCCFTGIWRAIFG